MPEGDARTAVLLATLEAYFDAVPRTAARAEAIGPFTFVDRVRARQRALAVPEAFEWVAELAPGLRAAAETAGLTVADHPLMVLAEEGESDRKFPVGIEVRLVTPDDDLRLVGAVAPIGFAAPGTDVGAAGVDALREAAAARDAAQVEFERERLRTGRTVMAVALADGVPVAVGSHQPVGSVSEVVGVATLPAFRRRGIAAALTALLTRDARERGVETVFLSAGDLNVARVYEQVGFRRIATACVAEPPSETAH